MVCALIGFAWCFGWAGEAKPYSLVVSGKSRLPVLYFADHAIEAVDTSARFAVIVIHGVDSGTDDYASSIRTNLQKNYPHLVQPYIIAPCFPWEDLLSQSRYSGYACWAHGNWANAKDSTNAGAVSAYDVVDEIFEILSDVETYPKLEHVLLLGFSAGGQFVNRYVAVGNGPKREDLQVDYAVGSPSSYLYMDDRRVSGNGAIRSLTGGIYPGYNNWHCGLAGRSNFRYVKDIADERIWSNLMSRHTLYFCGLLDDDPEGNNVSTSNGAMAQGAHRLERFRNFRTYVAAYPKWAAVVGFVEIDGMAHSSSKGFANEDVMRLFFGIRPAKVPVGLDEHAPESWFVDGKVSASGDGKTLCGAFKTISEAVRAASDGDVIGVAGGVYPAFETMNKRILIKSLDRLEPAVVDGRGSSRCATLGMFMTDTNTVVQGMVLTNGFASSGAGCFGGTLKNCTIVNNRAEENGGGCFGGVAYECRIDGNETGVYGGGAYQSELSNCKLEGNKCGKHGGAMYYGKMEGCTVISNVAALNAGGLRGGSARNTLFLYNESGQYGGASYGSELANCVVARNTALSSGGGVSHCDLYDCQVISNFSYNAGGVRQSQCIRSTVCCNISTGSGGGAWKSKLMNSCVLFNSATNRSASGGGCYYCTNLNCTIYGNYAAGTGGGTYYGEGTNTIVWGNRSGSGYANARSGVYCYCLSDSVLSGMSNVSGDPLFNDVVRSDFRLKQGSPCLDRGCNAYCRDIYDVLGHGRIQNGIVDIGACEGIASTAIRGGVEVPYAWIDQFPTLVREYSGDYERIVTAASPKKDVRGNVQFVWQDYVAGTCPTNSDDMFRASITFDSETGKPVVDWVPKFVDQAEADRREYRIFGKERVDDESWTEVKGDEERYNFFKVSVRMK